MDFPDVQRHPEPMDSRLQERLDAVDAAITACKAVEAISLQMEGHEDAFYAKIFVKQKTGSVEDRKQAAFADPEWTVFTNGLAVAKANTREAQRRLELAFKAYDGAHLTVKNEAPAVRRQL